MSRPECVMVDELDAFDRPLKLFMESESSRVRALNIPLMSPVPKLTASTLLEWFFFTAKE